MGDQLGGSGIFGTLTRVTSSGRFIPEIDGLRFIAIALVVLFHISNYISFRIDLQLSAQHSSALTSQQNVFMYVVSRGSVGVHLFFAISGFILGLPFAEHALLNRKKVSLPYYLLRRLTRLEPPYLLGLAISLLLLICFERSGVDLKAEAADVLLSMFYLHNQVTGRISSINIAYWSLEVEVQFYLLAPLLAKVFSVRPSVIRRLLICAAILLCGCLQLSIGTTPRIFLSIVGQLHYFLAGFLLVDVYVTDWKGNPPHWGLTSTLLWVVGWPLLFLLVREDHFAFQSLLLPFVIVMLYLPALCHAPGTTWLRWRVVSVIGGMCYSIYLLHLPIIYGVGRWTGRIGGIDQSFMMTFIVNAALMLPVILLISTAFFVLVERPCMDRTWPSRLLQWVRGA